MKNLVRLSTGIVFIMAILIAGGCCSKKKAEAISVRNKKDVIIFATSYEINGIMHLKLFDSNGDWAIDSLTTDVHRNGKVIWKLDTLCAIKEIHHIEGSNGPIFKKNPKASNGHNGKQFELDLPDNIKPKDIEKYDIYFLLYNDTAVHHIDPFLRVPDA